MADCIVEKFYQKMKHVNFETYGILDSNNQIHTLGTDSKIIGRIFEMFAQPILEEIATELNMTLKTPESQTVYPDFVMFKEEKPEEKIAIDIKTTYVSTDQSIIKFTLGSYGSYMRNNTKNIAYRYTDYSKHYVIGFIYKRNDRAQESRVYKYENRKEVIFPYTNVKYFMEEKYKIAGDKPGSGNTENIGSFPTRNFLELQNGQGPFSELAKMYLIFTGNITPNTVPPKNRIHRFPNFLCGYQRILILSNCYMTLMPILSLETLKNIRDSILK